MHVGSVSVSHTGWHGPQYGTGHTGGLGHVLAAGP